MDPSTGTVKVTVATPRQEGLRPGMYVEVELVTAVHGEALLVPKRALVYDNDQVFVFRLKGEERRVERLRVNPLLENTDSRLSERIRDADRIGVHLHAALDPLRRRTADRRTRCGS